MDLKEFNLDPHIFGTYPSGRPRLLTLGPYGVSIFFVLSGFLITYLLLVEKEVQTIDIKKFYLRRIKLKSSFIYFGHESLKRSIIILYQSLYS